MMAKFARNARKGFTLVEIMIVVLIIGILLAIAIPNFIKARESSRQKACIANLKQIESAKEQWAMDTRATKAAVPTTTNLYGSDAYIKTEPLCPAGGTYTISALSTRPSCSLAASPDLHVLP